jgi:hypothetical protein
VSAQERKIWEKWEKGMRENDKTIPPAKCEHITDEEKLFKNLFII